MAVIWKYDIPPGPSKFTLWMPKKASILTVQEQQQSNPSVVMWALVEADYPLVNHNFMTVWTGQEFVMEGGYVGTFQVLGLVYHLFDLGEED